MTPEQRTNRRMQNKEYYARLTPEQLAKRKEDARLWRESHRDKLRAKGNAQYAALTREQRNHRNALKRARRAALSPEDVEQVRKREAELNRKRLHADPSLAKKYRESRKARVVAMTAEEQATLDRRRREIQRRWADRHPGYYNNDNRTPEQIEQRRQQRRQWYQQNREKALDSATRSRQKKLGGHTPESKADQLKRQEFKCAICKADLKVLDRKKVHGDHCHKTGIPRGVLCHWCNAGIGHFDDDRERLQAAIEYLRQFDADQPS